jgi:CHAT domain-containing protein/Tfp pilus assembly protein PilF
MGRILFLVIFVNFFNNVFSQTITADTTLANQYFDLARKYENNSRLDSAIFFAEKAQELNIKYFGRKSIKNANILHLLGRLCNSNNKYDLALEYNFMALQIRKEILGEMNIDVAKSYINIGVVYYNIGDYDKALESYFNALRINKEVLGEKHPDVAHCYNNIGNVYYERGDYDKALEYNFKALQIRKEILGEKHPDVAASYNNIGNVYSDQGEYDKALEYYFKALIITKEIFGDKHPDVAASYDNIGNVYSEKGEYKRALEYYFNALQIRKEMLGEKHPDVATSYDNIGNVYSDQGEYDKALEYNFMALQIRKEILGENHPYVAMSYSNIGIVYYNKGEYDKALEYYFMALQIKKEILGEKHALIASSYSNIGAVYYEKGEYDKALEYHLKALQIDTEISGEKHLDVAADYSNIGAIYEKKVEYNNALEYLSKALQIRIEILGEEHPDVAASYNNIGNVYYEKDEYDKALEYYFKALQISKGILGEKHPYVAATYKNVGIVYYNKGEYNKALEYYQKEAASCLYDFNDTVNVYVTPTIRGYLDWNYLLQALQAKADIIADRNKTLKSLIYNDRNKIALRHYQACDTLIDITRKEISTQSDKLALGEIASQVYKEAINLLTSLQTVNIVEVVKNISDNDHNLAFYFSEKSKSSVLLEALAGQEAQKYAGIADSLLTKENKLKREIAEYTKMLAEPEYLDSAQAVFYQNSLFQRNRSLDSLIQVFEAQYPEYHNLKYNTRPVTVGNIQQLLDKKSAMISYSMGDSAITIFTITKNDFFVQSVPKMENLSDSILWYRYSLTHTTRMMQDFYQRLGYTLYRQLFPAVSRLNKNIENLYIIPDGELAVIPFESLLTENYTGDINDYKEYPYLIKKYTISYSYSATLFHMTFSPNASSTIEVTDLNDWLAFAPVFDYNTNQTLTLSTRELQKELDHLKTDSLLATRSMFDRNYITPLPATENETEAILKLYDDNHRKAKILLHESANERYIKSGELEHYKALHLATHGFVNSEHPELSGLLLAQDTIGGEDGVLYSGEIYNLKLHADLVVLSACETGLGKIQKGEGIIGLTRALLYAGAKNIIVSLWQVADESTSKLMVDFYKNNLENKGKLSYSQALRQAKLKMISEGEFAHPLYWSPFILIGK